MAGSKKTVWDLALEITGQDKGATAALRQIKKNIEDVKNAGSQLGKDFKDFAGSATKLALGVVAGVTAAGAGVLAMANSFATAGDQVAKTADSLGMAIEGYQRLRFAMGDAGVEASEFDGAIQKMTNTINMAAAGNEAARRQLEGIGLDAQKLATMRPEQAFERIADYMQTLPSDAARAEMAITLFGKTAGPRMAAAMRMGSQGIHQLGDEAESLGIIFSESAARSSEEYNNQLSRLKYSVTGMKNQFISGAIGPLTQAFETLKNAMVEQMPTIRELGDRFGQWIGELVNHLPEIIEKVKEFGRNLVDMITNTKDLVGGWGNLAKIAGTVAVAPTAIKGAKTMWSFGTFLKTAVPKIGLSLKALIPIGASAAAGVAGVGAAGGAAGAGVAAAGAAATTALGAIAAAALPVTAIIAGIVAVIITVKRNFQNLKDYVTQSIARIKDAIGGGTGEMAADFAKIGDVVKKVLGVIGTILESGVLYAIKTVINTLTSAIVMVIGAFKVLWNVVKLILWPIETVVKVIIGLFKGGWKGALDALGGQFEKLKRIFSGIMDGFKTIFKGVADFWKGQFENAKEMVNRILAKFGTSTEAIFNTIKNIIAAVGRFFVNLWKGVVSTVKAIIKAFGNFFKAVWQGVVNVVKTIIQGLGNFFRTVFDGIKIAVSAVGNFFKNVWQGAVNVVTGIIDGFRSFFGSVFSTIRNIVSIFTEFFRNVFSNPIEAVKNLFRGIVEVITGVFNSIRDKVTSFVSFFTDKFKVVGDIIGGVGNFLGGAVSGVKNFVGGLFGHADGGIFTTRHIAEICEKGPEAVVPLDKSTNGFDIWKEAGMIGGYLNKMAPQGAGGGEGSSTPPVMEAAASRMSEGSGYSVNVNFSMTNNFAGSPDANTVSKIEAAGNTAADNFEQRVKEVIERIARNQARVSYA